MTKIRPWGHINWLSEKFGAREWTGVFCASFEQRSLAAPQWLSQKDKSGIHHCLKIQDPIGRFTTEIDRLTKEHQTLMSNLFIHRPTIYEHDLLSLPGIWNDIAHQITSKKNISVLLDISCMPKRVFLFITKRLLHSENVKDLVITYTKPDHYKEGQLTEDALPPSALPGFIRERNEGSDSLTIVSVGYMAFNLGDLLERQRGRLVKFLFPFPPGSPGFRRSWKLLHELSQGMDIQTEIKRLDSMDMFAAVDWLNDIKPRHGGNIDLIPLGPKPHALAMGLAFPALGETAEISYSQPTLYHPDYSTGIKVSESGIPEIISYCLKRNHIKYA